MSKEMKAKIDAFLNSWISKKLMVFVIATILAFSNKLTGDQFVNVAIMYIGTQGAIDAIRSLRNFKQHN
jgi:hypothetical protein